MADKPQVSNTADLVSDVPELTIEDLCEACGLSKDQIAAYVSEGIIEPQVSQGVQWRFSSISLIELRRATRLERDLRLNAAGVALVLELKAEIETLQRRLARFERDNETDH